MVQHLNAPLFFLRREVSIAGGYCTPLDEQQTEHTGTLLWIPSKGNSVSLEAFMGPDYWAIGPLSLAKLQSSLGFLLSRIFYQVTVPSTRIPTSYSLAEDSALYRGRLDGS